MSISKQNDRSESEIEELPVHHTPVPVTPLHWPSIPAVIAIAAPETKGLGLKPPMRFVRRPSAPLTTGRSNTVVENVTIRVNVSESQLQARSQDPVRQAQAAKEMVVEHKRHKAATRRTRLQAMFRRLVRMLQVVGVFKATADKAGNDSKSRIRRESGSASLATRFITVTNPQPALDITIDPMQLGFIRFRQEWVVDRAGDRYYYWLALLSVAVVYNTVMVVPRSVFAELDRDAYLPFFYVLDYLSDLLYIIDLVVQMFTGYLDEGVIVQEPRKLIRHYFSFRSSKLDILSIIPTDVVLPFTGIDAPYPFVRINRLLKYGRFSQFFSRLESRSKYPDMFRLGYLVLQFIVMMHLNACLFYFISAQVGLNTDGWVYPGDADWRKPADSNSTNDDDPLHLKYVWCYYWALQTLTLIGQLKQPEFEGEFAFVTVNFLFGVIIYANIIGNVTRMIANMNADLDAFSNRMDAVKQYMALRKIEGPLQKRITSYFEYQWTNHSLLDEAKAVACLPDKLEAELALRVHLETLKKVHIFQDVEPGLLADLVLKLNLEIYSPGDYICCKGDIGKEMYIVKRGFLEVVSDDGGTVFATLAQGSVFGEISLLNIVGIRTGNRRTANVRSVGYSDLFCLSKHDLWDALQEYPEAKKRMISRGRQMLLKDNLLDEQAADLADHRQKMFIGKVERVERSVDQLQARFGRLVAEKGSSLRKMRARITRLRNMVNFHMYHMQTNTKPGRV